MESETLDQQGLIMLVIANGKLAKQSRENSLMVTKLEEALMWHRADVAGGVIPIAETTACETGCGKG